MSSQYNLKRIQPLTNRQKKLLDKVVESVDMQDMDINENPAFQSGLSRLLSILSGDPEAFKDFEAPYRKEFEEEIAPGLAERFSGMGASRSSAFNQAFARAGEDLTMRLAALRSGLQMQALPQALQYASAPGESAFRRASLGLGTEGRSFIGMPKKPGFWEQFRGSVAQSAGRNLGNLFFGGGMGGGGGGGASAATPQYQQIFF